MCPSELPPGLPPRAGHAPASPSDPHVDGETLALLALGEDASTAAQDAHLASCSRCRDELDQLRAVVATGRSVTEDDRVVAPPASVWEGIAAEVALGSAAPPAAATGTDASGTVSPESPEPSVPPHATGQATESVTSLEQRRARRTWSSGVLVAASVASLAVGIALTAVVMRGPATQPTPPGPTTSVVAAASLAALPDRTGSGEAQIVTRDGIEYLKIDASDLSEGNGFYEVWLIDPRTMQMVGLGALDSPQGLFPVPTGLDLTKYRLVDVSLEPLDGRPTHSGNSIVRGELAT